MRLALPALLLVAALAPARADDFWTRKAPTEKERKRFEVVVTGDVYLQSARKAAFEEYRSSGQTGNRWSRRVEADAIAALRAYEKAIAEKDDARVRYRAFVATTYVDTKEGWEELIEHADGLRKVDPSDPHEWWVTWEAAVARSKLGMLGGTDADEHFAAAVDEYARWRRLVDETTIDAKSLSTAITNTAEILMALGRLDEAIAHYEEAYEVNPSGPTSALTLFGLAVAYDRDGQWENATRVMQQIFLNYGTRFEDILVQPGVFFVPDGDIHYYRGLGHQLKGKAKDALREYEIFLTVCTSSRYKDRAREHVAELEAKK